MTTQSKIYLGVFVWLIVTVVFFSWILPRQRQRLSGLKASHNKQLEDLQRLTEQVRSFNQTQAELQALKNGPVRPEDFFGKDVNLVEKIEHIEAVARLTRNIQETPISGSVETSQVYKQSFSGLYQIPYSIKISGAFKSAVHFFRYLENSYFVSPVNGFGMSVDDNGQLQTNILTNFFIQKNENTTETKDKQGKSN